MVLRNLALQHEENHVIVKLTCPAGAVGQLCLQPLPLIHWVRQLAVCIRQLPPCVARLAGHDMFRKLVLNHGEMPRSRWTLFFPGLDLKTLMEGPIQTPYRRLSWFTTLSIKIAMESALACDAVVKGQSAHCPGRPDHWWSNAYRFMLHAMRANTQKFGSERAHTIDKELEALHKPSLGAVGLGQR